jgi:MtN3 and saliva related transmembrane protein
MIGITAGIFTAVSLIPQLVKLIREKKSQDISIPYLVTLLVGLCLWIVYGAVRNDLPILATNIFSVLVNILMLVFGIKYKERS